MNKLLKIGIPLLLILVILIVLYYSGHIKINFGEAFNQSSNSVCKPLLLKNIEYDDEKDEFNTKKFFITDTEKNNYYALIENNQPYGFFPNYKFDNDELVEVKISSQYVWCLNSSRNQIKKAKYNNSQNINNLQFNNLISNNYLECYDSVGMSSSSRIDCIEKAEKKIKYITAFGVCKEVNSQFEYCCFAVTDFLDLSKSYILIINSNYEDKIDLYNDFNENQNTNERIYIKTGKMLTGNIIMEKLKVENKNITFKLSCINNLDYEINDSNFRNKTNILQYNLEISIDSESFKPKIGEQPEIIQISGVDISINYDSLPKGKNEILKDIEKIKLHLNSNPNYPNYSKKSKSFVLEKELTVKSEFNNFSFLIDEHFSDNIQELHNDLTNDDNDEKNKIFIGICYKFMNRIINFLCSKNIKLGFYNIEHINEKYYIIKSNENNQELELNLIELENLTQKELESLTSSPFKNVENVKLIDSYMNIETNIGELKKNIIIKENKNLKISDIANNLKIISEDVEMIGNKTLKDEVKKKLELEEGYSINVLSLDFFTNVIGILEYDLTKIQAINNNMISNKIIHPRKVLFFLNQKITNIENIIGKGKEKEDIYGRFINKNVIPIKYFLIPNIKFDYGKQFLRTGINRNLSLLSYFFDKTSKTNELDKNKFQNYFDWIKIYRSLKSTGNYYPNKFKQFEINKSLMFQALENELEGDFLPQHKNILNEPDEFENVFDFENLKIPNFEIYSLDNSNPESTDDNEVFLSPRVNNFQDFIDEDNEDNETNISKRVEVFYIGLDTLKLNNNTNTINHNNQKYYHYKIIKDDKEKVDINKDNKYIWNKKKINNFIEYKKLILDKKDTENLDRSRLRGLFEIDDKYIDDTYITYIEKLKKDNIEKLPLYEIQKFDKFLEEKKNIVIERVINIENNKKINPLGYPFDVIYKNVDVRGNPCLGEDKDSQKLFLVNTLHKNHIFNNGDSDEKYLATIQNLEKERDYIYPFIKQEFFSYTGYGNLIQFSISKKGGITSIESKKVCRNKDTSFSPGCNKISFNDSENCNNKKLGLANIDGTPKCEIVAQDVKKASETSVETLVPHSIDINACNLYINKGDHKIYYKLGRVFQNSGEKIQIKNTYTIQLTEGEKKNYYLYYNKNGRKIEKKAEVNEDTNEIQNYWFVGTLKNDIYGSYMLFNPQQNKNNYLTAKVDILNHTIDDFTLQNEINTDYGINRNALNNNYQNDRDYYSQKFIVPDSLVRNMIANDGTDNEDLLKYMNDLEIRSRIIGSFGLDGLTTGSTNYETGLSKEEEAKIIEDELANLIRYLNNLNTIFQQEQFDIEGLKENLKIIKKQMTERIPFIEKKLKNIKYLVSISDKLKNRDMRIITENTITSGKKKTSGNNKELSMERNFENTDSALEALKDIFNNKKLDLRRNQINKRKKEIEKCKVVEGFENQYLNENNKYNNHVTDKYQSYLKNEVENAKIELKKKHNKISELLNRLSNVSKFVNYDSKHKDLLISQVIDNNNKLNTDVREIKNREQDYKIKQLQEKINQVRKLSCGLKKNESTSEENMNYRSLISKEDGEVLTTYEFNPNNLNRHNEINNSDNLKMNMILVNGGCLSFDQENEKLNIEHCMIGNENQQFMINHIKSKEDLNEFKLDQSKGFDKSFSLVRQPIKNLSPIPSDPLCVKNKNDYCLHKENGEISMRECDNIRNHKWIYSNVSSSCN